MDDGVERNNIFVPLNIKNVYRPFLRLVDVLTIDSLLVGIHIKELRLFIYLLNNKYVISFSHVHVIEDSYCYLLSRCK